MRQEKTGGEGFAGVGSLAGTSGRKWQAGCSLSSTPVGAGVRDMAGRPASLPEAQPAPLGALRLGGSSELS